MSTSHHIQESEKERNTLPRRWLSILSGVILCLLGLGLFIPIDIHNILTQLINQIIKENKSSIIVQILSARMFVNQYGPVILKYIDIIERSQSWFPEQQFNMESKRDPWYCPLNMYRLTLNYAKGLNVGSCITVLETFLMNLCRLLTNVTVKISHKLPIFLSCLKAIVETTSKSLSFCFFWVFDALSSLRICSIMTSLRYLQDFAWIILPLTMSFIVILASMKLRSALERRNERFYYNLPR